MPWIGPPTPTGGSGNVQTKGSERYGGRVDVAVADAGPPGHLERTGAPAVRGATADSVGPAEGPVPPIRAQELRRAYRCRPPPDRDRTGSRRRPPLRPGGGGPRVPARRGLRPRRRSRPCGPPAVEGPLRRRHPVPRAVRPLRLPRRMYLARPGHRHHDPAAAPDRTGRQAGGRGGPTDPGRLPARRRHRVESAWSTRHSARTSPRAADASRSRSASSAGTGRSGR